MLSYQGKFIHRRCNKMHHSLRHPDGENSSIWKPAVFASNVLGNYVACKELFCTEINVYSLLCFKSLTCYIGILSNCYSSVWVQGFSLFVLGQLFCLFGVFLTKKNPKPTKNLKPKQGLLTLKSELLFKGVGLSNTL